VGIWNESIGSNLGGKLETDGTVVQGSGIRLPKMYMIQDESTSNKIRPILTMVLF
jgi:hypothetical protein